MIQADSLSCDDGHSLLWSSQVTAAYPKGRYICDRCEVTLECAQNRWWCSSCEYDICPSCHPRILPSDTVLNTCPQSHILTWSSSNYVVDGKVVNSYRCSICMGSFPCNSGRSCCLGCNYNICDYCTNILKCSGGHKLTWCAIASGPYARHMCLCDRCRTRIDCSNGRWHCYSCEFDLCVNCASTKVVSYYNPPQPKVEIAKDSDPVDVNEKLQCNICMDKTVQYVLIPCGHMLCQKCSEKSDKCPFDRKDIAQKVRMYYP